MRARRRLHVAVANWCSIVLGRGVRGWARNRLLVMPALGSMTLLLLAAGSAAGGSVAAANALAAQSDQAYLLRLYLADGASPARAGALTARLQDDPRVRAVRLVDSEEALRRALRRPGVAGLVDAAGSNPFPASLEVRLGSGRDIGAVAADYATDEAVDPVYPSSYDPDAYGRLQRLVRRAALLAAAVLALLGLVAVVVTANSVRAAAFARRDEIRVMRLVGAPWWAVRLPIIVEGGLTGAAAGLLASAAVAAWMTGAQRAGIHVFVDLLPGVTPFHVGAIAAGTALAGVILGGASGAVALRRLP